MREATESWGNGSKALANFSSFLVCACGCSHRGYME
jgi:hypothetical protein